ncbi:MAG: acetyl-CoA carboxylase biotin carboxyl carrier protein subunit [Candidatus Poseidoniales archaeon]|nr:acetyl-CoA carboxylase biotin carboxyl carrier protein subunit [Candidatus Poseidoniales archaeon]|tara:strand:- start:927 stop:1394 length:468 start_codon:yes stop_codon:yes gene_type:complete
MVDLRDSSGRHWQITIGSADAICDDEVVPNEHSFEIDARPNRLWVDGQLAHTVKVGDDWWVHLDGRIHVLTIDEQGAGGSADAGGMTAPMPGKVLEILCSIGEEVEEGQTLIVMEAMKMEHRIAANGPGTIVAIHHEVGEQVDAGTTLIDIEEIE